jgi:ubiquinone/menaquinone biosynthesis C-methylase UbiE
MKNDKPVFDMGSESSRAFLGVSSSQAMKEIYADSAPLFTSIIRSKFTNTEKEYSLLDIGTHKGEFLSQIVDLLPKYNLGITATDTNSDSLMQHISAHKKVIADAEFLPFNDSCFDIVLMRYVLQFNPLENQARILSEVSRVTRGIAIVQHGGADDISPELWRAKVHPIFSDDKLLPIKRTATFWSSATELEDFMIKSGIRFEKILSKRINGLSQVYIEKYSLNNDQTIHIKEVLGDKDYIIQTTWIIYPKL